jgi:hypothetical protein
MTNRHTLASPRFAGALDLEAGEIDPGQLAERGLERHLDVRVRSGLIPRMARFSAVEPSAPPVRAIPATAAWR